MSKLKNTLDRINGRLDMREEKIMKLNLKTQEQKLSKNEKLKIKNNPF